MKTVTTLLSLLTYCSFAFAQNNDADEVDALRANGYFVDAIQIAVDQAGNPNALRNGDVFHIDQSQVVVERGGNVKFYCDDNVGGIFRVNCTLKEATLGLTIGKLYVFSSLVKACPKALLNVPAPGPLMCRDDADCYCYYLRRPTGPDDEYGTGND